MTALTKFKKQVRVNVKTNAKGSAALKFPKQSIGTVWIESVNGVILGQWNLVISKNSILTVEKL